MLSSGSTSSSTEGKTSVPIEPCYHDAYFADYDHADADHDHDYAEGDHMVKLLINMIIA